MNPRESVPQVLIIDDDETTLLLERDEVNRSGEIHVNVLHPDDVTASRLTSSTLVLVDYMLETWPAREQLQTISLQPATGLALITILQEHAHRAGSASPRAFALHTGKAEQLRHDLAHADHVVARAHGLDWVFSKSTESKARWAQITSLAKAVRNLPEEWSVEDRDFNTTALRLWLALPDASVWGDRAWRDVEDCHPPAHELARLTHGEALTRWMLHRILPYPTFLMGLQHLAARLHVTTGSLRLALEDEAFRTWLRPCRYIGQLCDFLGLRWWRSGVESLVFELTSADPGSVPLLVERLREKSAHLEPCSARDPIVVIDSDYQIHDELCDVADGVRIAPDDWPAFADTAWTSLTLTKSDNRLRAIVVSSDRERLRGPAAS